MKQTSLFAVLLTGALFLFSCQKAELTKSSTLNVQEIPSKANQSNGGGPYVLNIVVELSGLNEVPAVNTTATGKAHLRLASDSTLYSKITVENLEEGDALRAAHVHEAPAGVNGGVKIFLARSAADFGQNIVQKLTGAQYDILLNNPTYVNAHSNVHPGGIVRGQIR